MSRLKKGGAAAVLVVGLVAGFEGLRTAAYRDSVGIPTICYGETRGVRMGMTRTRPECEGMLVARLDEFANGVEACVSAPMSDPVFASFVSLSYNIGTGAFCRSSVVSAFNAGAPAAACSNILKFNRAGGRVLPGLVRRREAERDLCMKGL